MAKKRIGMDPYQWIDEFLDENSFQLINSDKDSENFGNEVIAGIGQFEGRTVCVYAHNPRIAQGFITSQGADKICAIMDKAFDLGVPVISFMASPGVSVEEGILSGDHYTKVIVRNIKYSGIIPQIAVVLSTTMGAPAYSATLMDYIIFNKVRSSLMVTGPTVIEEVLGEKTSIKELGGSEVHSQKTGIADFVAKDIASQFEKLKQLVRILPSNNIESPPKRRAVLPNAALPEIAKDLKKPLDMYEFIKGLFDNSQVLELKSDFAPSLITALGYIGGNPVGILANQAMHLAGAIDYQAARKGARFLKLCDSYNFPIINLIDVPGFMPGEEQEHNGLLRYGAQMCQAMSTSTPRFSVVVSRCYGAAAYLMMQTKSQGGDFVMALENSRIAIMGYEAAKKMLYQDSEKDMSDVYYDEYENPENAKKVGMVDQIISADFVREKLIDLCKLHEGKKLPEKSFRKHMTLP